MSNRGKASFTVMDMEKPSRNIDQGLAEQPHVDLLKKKGFHKDEDCLDRWEDNDLKIKETKAEGLVYKGSEHPGFRAVQEKIASEYGGNMKKAGAILASRTRNASTTAREKNPRLNNVKGKSVETVPSAINMDSASSMSNANEGFNPTNVPQSFSTGEPIVQKKEIDRGFSKFKAGNSVNLLIKKKDYPDTIGRCGGPMTGNTLSEKGLGPGKVIGGTIESVTGIGKGKLRKIGATIDKAEANTARQKTEDGTTTEKDITGGILKRITKNAVPKKKFSSMNPISEEIGIIENLRPDETRKRDALVGLVPGFKIKDVDDNLELKGVVGETLGHLRSLAPLGDDVAQAGVRRIKANSKNSQRGQLQEKSIKDVFSGIKQRAKAIIKKPKPTETPAPSWNVAERFQGMGAPVPAEPPRISKPAKLAGTVGTGATLAGGGFMLGSANDEALKGFEEKDIDSNREEKA